MRLQAVDFEVGEDVADGRGWDGDRCGCVECRCPRFLDGTDPERCPDCAEGKHWASAVPKS